jgi:hypothetical protein
VHVLLIDERFFGWRVAFLEKRRSFAPQTQSTHVALRFRYALVVALSFFSRLSTLAYPVG